VCYFDAIKSPTSIEFYRLKKSDEKLNLATKKLIIAPTITVSKLKLPTKIIQSTHKKIVAKIISSPSNHKLIYIAISMPK